MSEQSIDSLLQEDNLYSFDISDEKKILDCYNKYGLVVVRNVLTKVECKETFKDLNLPAGCDITKPETYSLMDNVVNRYGVLGSDPLFTKAVLKNRTHPNVQKIFKLLYGVDAGPLLVQHDRIGVMRPTVGLYGQEKWRVPDIHPNLHLDINVPGYFAENFRGEVDKFLGKLEYNDLSDFIAENNVKHETMGKQIQAVLSLVDNREEDGGFHCIPQQNSDKILKEWYESSTIGAKPEANGRYVFSNNNYDTSLLSKGHAIRTPCPAGSLILFSCTSVHGTVPNFSDRIRVIMFLRYLPESVIINHKKRAKRVKQECNKVGFIINEQNSGVLLGTKS